MSVVESHQQTLHEWGRVGLEVLEDRLPHLRIFVPTDDRAVDPSIDHMGLEGGHQSGPDRVDDGLARETSPCPHSSSDRVSRSLAAP